MMTPVEREVAEIMRRATEELNEAIRRDRELLPYRIIGYTAEECERDMRRATNGERGCANPEEHEIAGLRTSHMRAK